MDKKLTKTILLVDDEETLMFYLQTILQQKTVKYNLNLLTAANGDDALDIINKERRMIDLVSTDINHPGISGIELVQYINDNFPTIKTIICSAFISEEKLKTYNQIADKVIQKPFNVDEYISTVNWLLKISP